MDIDLTFLIVNQPVESFSSFEQSSVVSLFIINIDWYFKYLGYIVTLICISYQLIVNLSFTSFTRCLQINDCITSMPCYLINISLVKRIWSKYIIHALDICNMKSMPKSTICDINGSVDEVEFLLIITATSVSVWISDAHSSVWLSFKCGLIILRDCVSII